jgi:putative peptidoglycan lipid II flippase
MQILGAATLIALLTIASRIFGFGRNVVLLVTVGPTALGDIYNAASAIPNIIFEIVAGGAMAGLVVPLLAGPIAAGDTEAVRRTASALLTWTLIILTPLAALLALLAGPVISALDPTASPEQHAAGVTMLQIFSPMVPLYGLGIVLTGVLQSHRKFAWPALAPLLSSITVMISYVVFAVVAGTNPELSTVDNGEIMILAVGTMLAAAVLSGCLLIPVRGLGLKLRPSLDIQPEQRQLVSSLALAGMVTIGVQQLSRLAAIKLGLAASDGAYVIYNTAMTVFLLPWAVLAVPVATATYPTVATAHATGDTQTLTATVSRTGRAVVLLSCLGTALLAAVAWPLSDLFLRNDPAQARALAVATIAFAPGLIGYGLSALHQRTLYAVGAQKLAAVMMGIGWTVTIAASVALSALLPLENRAAALGLANSIGMTALGIALAIAVRKRCGSPAIKGMSRVTAAGVAASIAGGAAALALLWSIRTQSPGIWALIGLGVMSTAMATLVFAVVAALADRTEALAAWAKLERLLRRRRRDAKP